MLAYRHLGPFFTALTQHEHTIVLQRKLLSNKWCPNMLVNMVSANNAFENVSAGHSTLASHLSIFAPLMSVSVGVALR